MRLQKHLFCEASFHSRKSPPPQSATSGLQGEWGSTCHLSASRHRTVALALWGQHCRGVATFLWFPRLVAAPGQPDNVLQYRCSCTPVAGRCCLPGQNVDQHGCNSGLLLCLRGSAVPASVPSGSSQQHVYRHSLRDGATDRKRYEIPKRRSR